MVIEELEKSVTSTKIRPQPKPRWLKQRMPEIKRLQNENEQLLARIAGPADFLERVLARESKSAQISSEESTLAHGDGD